MIAKMHSNVLMKRVECLDTALRGIVSVSVLRNKISNCHQYSIVQFLTKRQLIFHMATLVVRTIMMDGNGT